MADIVPGKRLVAVEEIFHQGGPVPARPTRRAAAPAVIRDPFAGRYGPGRQGMTEDLEPPGSGLTGSLIRALGGDPGVVEGYGKGAIVGEGGELEHGAPWHLPGGRAMRGRPCDAKAIVASTSKAGVAGGRLDVPVAHISAACARSRFDAMEIGVGDAPRAGEIVLAPVMTTGPRVHRRVGGLAASEIRGEEGPG